MDTAESIAAAINASVDACCAGTITVEQCSSETHTLWTRARELAITDQVHVILQNQCLAEMEAACDRCNIELDPARNT